MDLDRDSLLKLLVFICSIGVFFSGTIIFLLMAMFKKQTDALEEAAKEVKEVKETLKATSAVNIEKMDDLAKEDTLKQLQEKSLVNTNGS